MELYLVDINPPLIKCWQQSFAPFPAVKIICGNILSIADDALVSPANSYGFMDGGIDAQYLQFFGMEIQKRVMDNIAKLSEQYLPNGSSLTINTGNKRIPYLIVAPTMITPGPTSAACVYHAMAAILKAVDRSHNLIKRVYCPGLGTGVGQVPYEDAAQEMMQAYKKWLTANSIL